MINTAPQALDHLAFVLQAIVALRSYPYRGIHTVYSGFNEAFREYFPGEDPVAVVRRLAADGLIVLFPSKGGALIYRPGDIDKAKKGNAKRSKTLGKILSRGRGA